MSSPLKITIQKASLPEAGNVVIFTDKTLKFQGIAAKIAKAAKGLERAMSAAAFKGKEGAVLDLLAPEGTGFDRLTLIGRGDADKAPDWHVLGAKVAATLAKGGASVTVALDVPGADAEAVALVGAGLRARAYAFETYKSKKEEDGEDKAELSHVTLMSDVEGAKKAWKDMEAVADGIDLTRTLVNEPANILYPETFAERASELKKLGVDIEILDDKAIKKNGMRALLAVGRGSDRESRVVIMRWNGLKDKDKEKGEAKVPVLIGKGVCFDSGGISIKPAASMEDMKGDMAGAATVVGTMHALAARKAPVHVVGIIGLVENMPDGRAYRPGDILTAMSGQTIEVINTDAEGRLVLADLITYAQEHLNPAYMIDLATLTGAILVALGQEHTGLFSNNDALADAILKTGTQTGDTCWRLPMGKAYDKLIDSQFADMKNTGGRFGGSITAAQFLQRFVKNDTPWAHLDIAGTSMAVPKTDANKSWASGWGVKLLNALVESHKPA